jgi:hypothetical protein
MLVAMLASERKATARRQTVSGTLSEAELDNFAAGMTSMFRAKGLEVLVVLTETP